MRWETDSRMAAWPHVELACGALDVDREAVPAGSGDGMPWTIALDVVRQEAKAAGRL
jgi:hypothetical protein